MNAQNFEEPSPLSRWAARVGVALIALALAGLMAAWIWDRTRRWETPRFDPARFVALPYRARVLRPLGEAPDTVTRWLVAMNPDCPHCREIFPRIEARLDSLAPWARLELLVVDASTPPRSPALEAFPADAAWWDSSGVWRRRWGHRIYGEVLRFGPDGALLGVDPPPR